MYKILEKKMLTSNICKMVLEAPRLAKAALPGQFLIVRADEKGERIPLTISDYDAAAELAAKYGVVSSTLKADIVNLELEQIPVDIRVSYE